MLSKSTSPGMVSAGPGHAEVNNLKSIPLYEGSERFEMILLS